MYLYLEIGSLTLLIDIDPYFSLTDILINMGKVKTDMHAQVECDVET